MSTPTSRVEVTLSDSTKIICKLFECPSPAQPGLLVLHHGRFDSKDTGIFAHLAPSLARTFNVLLFDARGMGESGGETTFRGAYIEAADLKEIIDHFISLGHTILGVGGHSRGVGAVGLWAGLCGPSLPTTNLIFLGGRYDTSGAPISRFTPEMKKILEEKGSFIWCYYKAGTWPARERTKPYLITKDDFDLTGTATLEEALVNLPEKTRVLLAHGKNDAPVPVKNAYMNSEAIGRGKAQADLWIVDAVGHYWENEGEVDYLEDYLTFWLGRRKGLKGERLHGEIPDSGGRLAGKTLPDPVVEFKARIGGVGRE